MDERARAEDLDRFLDALEAGPAGGQGDVDPELARIAGRYRALGRTPAPAGAAGRVWSRLGIEAGSVPGSRGIGPVTSNGRVNKEDTMIAMASPFTSRTSAAPALPAWIRRVAPLAAAAIMLLALTAGFLTVWRGDQERPRTVPAAFLATPSVEPTIETVLTTRFAADQFPAGGPHSAGIAVFTLGVGLRSTWEPTCCPGPMIEHVLEGTYGVRAEAPITVIRADGSEEEIAAGTDVTLTPGDSLTSRNETVVETWNGGDVPVVLLTWIFVDGDEGHLVPGWQSGRTDIDLRVTVPSSAATARLQRITWPAGIEGEMEAVTGQQFVVVVEGRGDVIRRTDGTIKGFEADLGTPLVVYLLTLEEEIGVSVPEASPAP
jgi:hypothetical protein